MTSLDFLKTGITVTSLRLFLAFVTVSFFSCTSLAETVIGPNPGSALSKSEATNPAKPSVRQADDSLPKGAEEYNKGCELFSIAKLQAGKGNLDGEKQLLKEAQKHFEAALLENPKLTEAQSNIAFIALTHREYRRAISLFEKALLLNPKHINSLNGLATAYALNDDIQNAMLTFDKLLTLVPGNSDYFFNKGSVLQKAGRFSEAKRAYEEAIRIQPRNQSALFNLGTLLENQGNLAAAKVYYERARNVDISNTAGLEALHRLDAINAELSSGTTGTVGSSTTQGKP
jgi:tetratricopeptide (TPR) repeat protein